LVTERLCRALASAGVVTIGGMARGIDTVGAWATLDAGGCSVGVIGSGLDVIYPPENGELMRAVTARGCIISEYPPGSPPTSSHFPHRNRIIAGLSRGVLVTEAPQKSGALITAQYALENNRDVFAVPRSLTDKNFLGTNLIIQQGAKLINNPNDILCEYPYAERVEIQKTKIKPVSEVKAETQSERAEKKQRPKEIKMELSDERYNNLNEKEKEIINVLKKKDTQIDEISRGLDISVSEVNTHLVLLEMKGLVKKLPGSTYQLKL
jgi:DNA processing protein